MNRIETTVDPQMERGGSGATCAFVRFVTAIGAGDDHQTEALCHQLTSADETALILLAQSAVPDECWWALRALASCGSTRCVETVANALADSNPELRQIAALTLGHLYRRASETVVLFLRPLAALLADDDGMVRQVAAAALSMCGDDAVAPLSEILAGSQQGARTRATQALRRIGSLRAAAVLYPYLEDSNHLVRTHAYEALDEMGLLENVLVTL